MLHSENILQRWNSAMSFFLSRWAFAQSLYIFPYSDTTVSISSLSFYPTQTTKSYLSSIVSAALMYVVDLEVIIYVPKFTG